MHGLERRLGGPVRADPGIEAADDGLSFPPREAFFEIERSFGPGVFNLTLSLGRPQGVLIFLRHDGRWTMLPTLTPRRTVGLRFRTEVAIEAIRVRPVEHTRLQLQRLDIDPAPDWRALLADVRVGPFAFPPRESLLTGEGEEPQSVRLAPWGGGCTVVEADAATLDGTLLTVAEANGALRLALERPLRRGLVRVRARIVGADGGPAVLKPRCYFPRGGELSGGSDRSAAEARLFHVTGDEWVGLARVPSAAREVIFRPREFAGALHVRSLSIENVSFRSALAAWTAIGSTRRRLEGRDRAELAAFRHAVLCEASRRHRKWIAVHEAESVRRWLARPLVWRGPVSVAIVGGSRSERDRTARSVLANGDGDVRLVEADAADILLPAGTRLAPYALAALHRVPRGPVIADADRTTLGLRHSPQPLAAFDRVAALHDGRIEGLLLVPAGEGSRFRRALEAAAVAHVPLYLTTSPGRVAPTVAAEGDLAMGPAQSLGTIGRPSASRTPHRKSRIAIITATRDGPHHLERYLRTLRSTEHASFDLVLVDNASTDANALALLAQAREVFGARIIHDDRAFNFAAMNNLAVAQSDADVLVFANNDIAFTNAGWLSALVAPLATSGVGISGAVLTYPDGRLQHAGKCLAGEVGVRHLHRFASPALPWLDERPIRTVAAVTGALMAVRAALFDDLSGFDAVRFPVLYNDTDFCLRAAERGMRTVLATGARAVHHESATLRSESATNLAKRDEARYHRRREASAFQGRWGHLMERDPHHPTNCDPGEARLLPWR